MADNRRRETLEVWIKETLSNLRDYCEGLASSQYAPEDAKQAYLDIALKIDQLQKSEVIS